MKSHLRSWATPVFSVPGAQLCSFVNAEPLIRAGVKLDVMPRFPGKLGSMTPNQWYLLPAGELEPHHGITFPFPLLIRAVNLK